MEKIEQAEGNTKDINFTKKDWEALRKLLIIIGLLACYLILAKWAVNSERQDRLNEKSFYLETAKAIGITEVKENCDGFLGVSCNYINVSLTTEQFQNVINKADVCILKELQEKKVKISLEDVVESRKSCPNNKGFEDNNSIKLQQEIIKDKINSLKNK